MDRTQPIPSVLADEPKLQERIDAFVVDLGESVDALQDAEATGDLKQLDDLTRALAREAGELGYPPLAEACLGVARAVSGDDADAVYETLVVLTEVARRIRLGHRSAA